MLFIGKVVNGEVIELKKTHFIVKVINKSEIWKGIVHISNMSDYFINDLSKLVKIGDIIPLKISEIKIAEKWLNLDYKSINPKVKKDPFVHEIKETPKGFATLRKWNNNLNNSEENND